MSIFRFHILTKLWRNMYTNITISYDNNYSFYSKYPLGGFYDELNDYFYKVMYTKDGYIAAARTCKLYGGTLPDIRNEMENQLIKRLSEQASDETAIKR